MFGIQMTKYIIASVNGLEMPIVFPEHITHVAMAKAVEGQSDGEFEVTGAGFWNVDARVAYGESMTLGVKSREEDTQILRQLLDPQ